MLNLQPTLDDYIGPVTPQPRYVLIIDGDSHGFSPWRFPPFASKQDAANVAAAMIVTGTISRVEIKEDSPNNAWRID